MSEPIGGWKTFVMTDDHIKLLRAAYVGWEHCEFGAPAIDCKRPYGNCHCRLCTWSVYPDIAEILGIEPTTTDEWGDHDFTDEQRDTMMTAHKGTQTALQIILATGSMDPGTYRASKYGKDWRAVVDDNE